MGAQQSIDTLTQLVDPYSVLDSAQPSPRRQPAPATPSSPSAALRRAEPAASASTSHISVTIDDHDEVGIDPPPVATSPSPSVQPPKDPLFDHPVDRLMSRIAPPAVVAILASPENSASELPMLNPRAQ